MKKRGIICTFERMITLYPTETVYGLGADPFDAAALEKLYVLKGRDAAKAVTWLVRDMEDVERYADVSVTAAKLAARFLPGPLTLVLPVKTASLPEHLKHIDSIGFRISSDPVAQKLIAEHMEAYGTPLTCTSANISGLPTLASPEEILRQFGEKRTMVDRIIGDGPRTGTPSTIIRVMGENVECIREGAYPFKEILDVLK